MHPEVFIQFIRIWKPVPTCFTRTVLVLTYLHMIKKIMLLNKTSTAHLALLEKITMVDSLSMTFKPTERSKWYPANVTCEMHFHMTCQVSLYLVFFLAEFAFVCYTFQGACCTFTGQIVSSFHSSIRCFVALSVVIFACLAVSTIDLAVATFFLAFLMERGLVNNSRTGYLWPLPVAAVFLFFFLRCIRIADESIIGEEYADCILFRRQCFNGEGNDCDFLMQREQLWSIFSRGTTSTSPSTSIFTLTPASLLINFVSPLSQMELFWSSQLWWQVPSISIGQGTWRWQHDVLAWVQTFLHVPLKAVDEQGSNILPLFSLTFD